MYTTRKLPNIRIDVADALRGIAVAGIILYHSVEHFNIFTQETIIHALPSDQTVADVLAWLLSGKMYGIFAMLFMFGIINVAFYDGDILMLYACYGLLLIPISYLPSKAVWCIIGCSIFCGYGLGCYYKLGITYAVMIGVGMVIAQYCFARFWFSSHQRGPLEGLWRKLTWLEFTNNTR